MANFLDLDNLLINELAGGVWIFLALALIIILIMAAKSKLPTKVAILLIALFSAIMVIHQPALQILWIFIVLGTGIMYYFKISKQFK